MNNSTSQDPSAINLLNDKKRYRIAYQGIPGRNSQVGASLLVESKGIKSTVLVPCVSSERIVNALLNNDCEFGVIAVRNSPAGDVAETSEG